MIGILRRGVFSLSIGIVIFAAVDVIQGPELYHYNIAQEQKNAPRELHYRTLERRRLDSESNITIRMNGHGNNGNERGNIINVGVDSESRNSSAFFDTNNTVSAVPFTKPIYLCGRKISPPYIPQYHNYPPLHFHKPPYRKVLLVLGTEAPYGRTGNQINALLHAFDFAKYYSTYLGIREHSWAMTAIQYLWMEITDNGNSNRNKNGASKTDWRDDMEEILGIVVLRGSSTKLLEQFEQYDKVIEKSAKEIYQFQSRMTVKESKNFHNYIMQTLFRHYNRGRGRTHDHEYTQDMCSGYKALFSPKTQQKTHKQISELQSNYQQKEQREQQEPVKYTVIHSRFMEGHGFRVLNWIASVTGCSSRGAINLAPSYIKSILAPLQMLDHPIVVITDEQQPQVIDRLRADPILGPNLRFIPEQSKWVGGDIMLGILSSVFIGNPASTLSGFIARSRIALGKNEGNYLFQRRNERGRWHPVCHEDCVFDSKYMGTLV